MTRTITTSSEEETMRAGRELANDLSGIVLLQGDLGAGKTTLVRGIVSGMPQADAGQVSSPTFTLIHDYGAGVFHIDLYRLETEAEVESLGLREIFDDARVVLIEWGERLGRLTPPSVTTVRIGRQGETRRVIQIAGPEESSVTRIGAA